MVEVYATAYEQGQQEGEEDKLEHAAHGQGTFVLPALSLAAQQHFLLLYLSSDG